MTENDRLKKIRLHFKLKQEDFAAKIGLEQGSLSDIERGKVSVSNNVKYKLKNEFGVNIDWLETGKGDMLTIANNDTGSVQFYEPDNMPSGKKLIPLYEDISTIGGNLPGYSANMESNSNHPTEWIDPGDWFKNATAAIRHYGESMTEYPPGSILALKEVQDRRLIIPGKDYVIETTEGRLTKKVQLCDNPEYLRVHSTNDEKYSDGTLIHQAFNIPLELILRIYEVLGYVVKKGGGTIVFSNGK